MPLRCKKQMENLKADVARLRKQENSPIAGSIVIAVNAKGDLDNVLNVISDLGGYEGEHAFETIFVVNNYDKSTPPSDVIAEYERLGIRVLCIPDVSEQGRTTTLKAKFQGIRAARSDAAFVLDADVRVPNPTALLNWYVEKFSQGAQVAYASVGHYDYPNAASIYAYFVVHHAARWAKRVLLRIPTPRGSAYAVSRSTMLELEEKGLLVCETALGVIFKREGCSTAYSGSRQLRVLTSARMFRPEWGPILPYYWYRLKYNLYAMRPGSRPVIYRKPGDTRHREYINNKPTDDL